MRLIRMQNQDCAGFQVVARATYDSSQAARFRRRNDERIVRVPSETMATDTGAREVYPESTVVPVGRGLQLRRRRS